VTARPCPCADPQEAVVIGGSEAGRERADLTRRELQLEGRQAPRYFQSQRQKPPRPSARPTATFLARRTTRRGLPEAMALMLLESLAAL
jgi:hypothetical protein